MSLLSPHDRTELLECLRPPAGYRLHTALATTYSMDLVALMVAPVGFTLFDVDPYAEDFKQRDPLELLESIRRHAEQMVIFHEAGRIAVPQHYRPLFAPLEGRLIAVQAPKKGYSFHPKVWIVRYANEAGTVAYRLICLSRNLTFDRCWDTALIMDGPLRDDRDRGFTYNTSLRKFVASLPGMAVRELASDTRAQVDLVVSEIARVEWDLGDLPFKEFEFWPLGFDGRSTWPFRDRLQRIVVVSPFLSDKTLKKLARDAKDNVLVGRREWLDKTSEQALAGFDAVYHMSDAYPSAEAVDDESLPGSEPPLQGLHAKLYVADDGWEAHTWTGSANASTAAFEGNVEFLVQLTGQKKDVGVDVFLQRMKGTTAFVDLLERYERPDSLERDEALEQLEKELDDLRREIAIAGWRMTLTARPGDQSWSIVATTDSELPDWGRHVTVTCRPLSAIAASQKLKPSAIVEHSFPDLSLELLTAYVVVDIEATTAAAKHSIRFVINAELVGAPSNRRERLLRHMLQDKQAVLRFLLLLLADVSDDPASDLDSGKGKWRGSSWSAVESEALFEPLVRALDRSPARLTAIRSLLDELNATEEGRKLIPDGLVELFDAVWAAREAAT